MLTAHNKKQYRMGKKKEPKVECQTKCQRLYMQLQQQVCESQLREHVGLQAPAEGQ
jgi:hypothetical protein